jgi:hypothetical protein
LLVKNNHKKKESPIVFSIFFITKPKKIQSALIQTLKINTHLNLEKSKSAKAPNAVPEDSYPPVSCPLPFQHQLASSQSNLNHDSHHRPTLLVV